ncbi:phloem protein 2-like protein [Tanacetum coccineum]|uniref:Phloem protein 2-like protein n=1 Tax=Tanacetum coccineum TaxID=301880 RepID=A0ABQ5DSI7_9ASTR
MVELFRFRKSEESIDSSLLLENFSRYHCGNLGVFVEGIEFIAIRSLQYEENDKLNDETKVSGFLKPELDKDSVERVAIDCNEILNRSENYIQDASKEELYLLLLNGIFIDNVNGKKCHMLPAKAFLHDTSNVSYNRIPQAKCSCSFAEFVQILPCHELRMKCNIETQLLSSDTTYACFLVFKLSEKCCGLKYPVKARDLLPYKKERTNIISFTPPSIVNLDKIKWIPKQREDRWMEVIVWETIFDRQYEEYIPMDLKLICFEGT